MICPKCNAENRDGAKFCNECGTRLSDSEHEQDAPSVQDEPSDASDASEDLHDSDIESQNTGVLHLPEISLDAPCQPSDETEVIEGAETPDEETSGESDDEDFDFDPIDTDNAHSDAVSESEEAASADEAAETRRLDLSGFDEYAPAGTYSIPSASWRDGGTMKMPRIEKDASASEQKSFRAPDKKKKGRKGVKIALIAVLVAAACAGIAALVTYQMELWGGKIVPDVVGMTQADATNTLESKGFTVRATQVKSDETEGVVLLMDPGSNSRLEEGKEVVIHVATARIIPEVLGVQKADAEAAMQAEGFSGLDGRTSIFDYCCVPAVQSWVDDAAFNDELLPDEQRQLRNMYKTILRFASADPVVGKGDFYDIMYANINNMYMDADKQYAFVRKYGNSVLLVISNFDKESRDIRLNLPAEMFKTLGIEENRAAEVEDILCGRENISTLTSEWGYQVHLPAYGGKILKFTYK